MVGWCSTATTALTHDRPAAERRAKCRDADREFGGPMPRGCFQRVAPLGSLQTFAMPGQADLCRPGFPATG